MNIQADITNERYSGEEELIIYCHSGAIEDMPDDIAEMITAKQARELGAGEWITIIDGEVVELGEFLPHTLYVSETPLDERLRKYSDSYTMTPGKHNMFEDVIQHIQSNK